VGGLTRTLSFDAKMKKLIPRQSPSGPHRVKEKRRGFLPDARFSSPAFRSGCGGCVDRPGPKSVGDPAGTAFSTFNSFSGPPPAEPCLSHRRIDERTWRRSLTPPPSLTPVTAHLGKSSPLASPPHPLPPELEIREPSTAAGQAAAAVPQAPSNPLLEIGRNFLVPLHLALRPVLSRQATLFLGAGTVDLRLEVSRDMITSPRPAA